MKTNKKGPHFVRTSALAQHFDIHPAVIYRMLDEGLPHLKCGRVLRFDVAEVEGWFAERTREKQQAKAA